MMTKTTRTKYPYRWFPLVICDSSICDSVCVFFPRLQKISANDGNDDYKYANEIIHIGIKAYQGELAVRVYRASSFYAMRKRFFRDTLSNFCKSKKCIISNAEYRPWSEKSKFKF